MSDDDFDLPTAPAADAALPGTLELGALSISLAVADIERSRTFYEALGFVVSGGDVEADYLILKNGESTIGLFQNMFDKNIVTFNPGLTNRMERLESFTDVRRIQEALQEAGVDLDQAVDADSASGPGSLMLTDPDGNPVLIDQFF